jgi:hypothetical protein
MPDGLVFNEGEQEEKRRRYAPERPQGFNLVVVGDADVNFGMDEVVLGILNQHNVKGRLVKNFQDFGGSVCEQVVELGILVIKMRTRDLERFRIF